MAAIVTEAQAGGWQMKQPPLTTQWTSQVNTNTPLPEYPGRRCQIKLVQLPDAIQIKPFDLTICGRGYSAAECLY